MTCLYTLKTSVDLSLDVTSFPFGGTCVIYPFSADDVASLGPLHSVLRRTLVTPFVLSRWLKMSNAVETTVNKCILTHKVCTGRCRRVIRPAVTAKRSRSTEAPPCLPSNGKYYIRRYYARRSFQSLAASLSPLDR